MEETLLGGKRKKSKDIINFLERLLILIAFADKHLDDKFYLEGTQRIDVRNKITRELCANLLIHREFFYPYPAKLIIEKNCIRTENANRAKMIGKLDIHSYEPYPKNPKLAKFFKEVGLADELGSGVKNMVKYTKIYSGGVPEFKEDDIFRTVIPITSVAENELKNTGDKPAISTSDKIIEYLKINDFITTTIAVEILELKSKSWVRECLNQMVKENILIAEGSNKNRKYRLNK